MAVIIALLALLGYLFYSFEEAWSDLPNIRLDPDQSQMSLREKNLRTGLFNRNVNPEYQSPRANYRSLPPPGSIRPAEFEEMDATILSVIDEEPLFYRLYVEMLIAYSQVGFTWIIAEENAYHDLAPMLHEAGIQEDSYAFLDYPIDSPWVRDYGPEFVIAPDGTRHIIDSYFLGAVAFWPRDDAVPIEIGRDDWINSDGSPMAVHSHLTPISGGNLMTDGAGTCFASAAIYGLEKPPRWSKRDVDNLMRDYFGCRQLIVLKPICLDPTGHIDLFAKIVAPNVVMLAEFDEDTFFNGEEYSEDRGHCGSHYPDDYSDMEDNLEILASTTNLQGEPWEVIRVPMLEPYQIGESWVYRSYLNSHLFNNLLLMPTYLTPHRDETSKWLLKMENEAISAYEEALPDARIAVIQADDVIKHGGAIHCLTHEIPAEEIEDVPIVFEEATTVDYLGQDPNDDDSGSEEAGDASPEEEGDDSDTDSDDDDSADDDTDLEQVTGDSDVEAGDVEESADPFV